MMGVWGIVVALSIAGLGAGLITLQKRLAQRSDLNKDYPNHLVPIPGEPEAILHRPSNPYIAQGVDDEQSGWCAARGQQQYGPFTWTQLYDMAAERQVIATDYILSPGASEWILAETITELDLR